MESWTVSLAAALVAAGVFALVQAATWSYQVRVNRRLDVERRLDVGRATEEESR